MKSDSKNAYTGVFAGVEFFSSEEYSPYEAINFPLQKNFEAVAGHLREYIAY